MYDWSIDDRSECVRTGLSELERYADRFDATKVRGYIFHMSRCGSTAIANALRELDGTIAISESRALSAILLAPRFGGLDVSASDRRTLALGFMGAVTKEFPCEHVVLKFPSLVSADIGHALGALPRTRWCFSSRKPSEIVRSFNRTPGGWLATRQGLLRAARLLGYDDPGRAGLANVLGGLLAQYVRSAIAAYSVDATYIDYSGFGEGSVADVAAFLWDRPLSTDAVDRIRRSLTFYSKARDRRSFSPDQPLDDPATGLSDLDQAYGEYLRRFFPELAEGDGLNTEVSES